MHAWLVANDPAYAKSVADGQTKRWDIPMAELEEARVIIGYSVWVKSRCAPALTQLEASRLVVTPKITTTGQKD